MRPTRDAPIGLCALLFTVELCVPEMARACGDESGHIARSLAAMGGLLLMFFVAQVFAGRFVQGRARSLSTALVSLIGLLASTVGGLAGFALALEVPVVGIPLVVLEVSVALGFFRALLAPRVGEAAPVV